MTARKPISTSLTPEEFANALKALGRTRASFVWDDNHSQLLASDPELTPIASALSRNDRDFDRHEATFLALGQQTGALLGAFLHRTQRGQGAGGVRHWRYSSVNDFLSDGLRLAHGMGRKNALAGLWWGGGKGVICQQADAPLADPHYRRKLFQDYGRFITSLRGAYVTAEDVGTNAADMSAIFETTRFVTCVPLAVGGSGNPSPATAEGVVCAMEAALEFCGEGGLANKTIAMQGTGNVGGFMIGRLLERGVAKIIASEISEDSSRKIKERFADERIQVTTVAPESTWIFEQQADVFAPNALGGILGPTTIGRIAAPIVCGAANNQLLDDDADAERLRERGIVHVPDFVANRMGIVQCANEQYGSVPDDPSILRHFNSEYENSVQRVTKRILRRAQERDTTPTQAANQLADELSLEAHPLWPGRSAHIVSALKADWHLVG